MYRLLVVDDEPYIVDWICEIAEVESGIELEVYRAYSVHEALNWLNRARIDIMITDIRMPGESGISLVQKVTRNWPKCKIIMLTAYAEFDYAYAAIESNVTAYILKTEDDARILEAIRKAVKELDKELKDLQLLNKTNDKLLNSMQPIQNDIIISILKGEIMQKEEIISQLESVSIQINVEDPFVLVISKIDGIPEKANIVDRFNYRHAVKKIIEHYFTQYFHCFQIEYSNVKIVLLLQPRKEQNGEEKGLKRDASSATGEYFITYTKGTLELVQQSCKENTGLDISFVVSNTLVELTQLHYKFQHMEKTLLHCVSDEKGVVISDAILNEQNHENSAGSSDKLEEIREDLTKDLYLLETYLENGDRENFEAGLKNICEGIRNEKCLHDSAAQEIFYSVSLMLLSYANRRKIAGAVASKVDISDLLGRYNHYSWNESIDYLYKFANGILEIQEKDTSELSLNLVQFINQYIQTHIAEDVSLIKLSEVTGYNPSYLSRLYKEIANETLSAYISRIRFEKAKNLLANSNLNLNEIATEVGLNSRTYFNRFIKKITGMSPQEYRTYLC
jgi:two-component system response regulator YesN